ncbi:MAG: L-seryl-tRNA(Sec) selenium transferase [Deltaproteobacteria bacterium]|nr:L-seryl-tRNA(Sec) selenium transferase [Deltaproteobacteria bacterium]
MAKPSSDRQRRLARLPAVDELLRAAEMAPLLAAYPRRLVLERVRRQLALLREAILGGRLAGEEPFDPAAFFPALAADLEACLAPRLRRVVNATGVVIHTNLGRSPLPAAALKQAGEIACRYSNLEYDLDAGCRGLRYDHVEELLCRLTGAEAAMVVNNNAGAVLLVLSALAAGREVIVSRGELIEIGGAFRIPEVITQGGARLREVGTTNRTHLRDYAAAIGEETGVLLKVHTSNYRVSGFTAAVDSRELVQLAAAHDLPVVEDLGSGSMLDLAAYGIGDEPTVAAVVESGMGVVTFSGDKLVGGPQAGIVVGRRDYLERIKRHPLNRALRIDKLTLAFLEEVLKLYLYPERAAAEIPTLAMLTLPAAALRRRAQRLKRLLLRADDGRGRLEAAVRKGVSRAGGGALPLVNLDTWLVVVRIEGCRAAELERTLRAGRPPIIARIEEEQLVFDPRTLFPGDDRLIARACAGLPPR